MRASAHRRIGELAATRVETNVVKPRERFARNIDLLAKARVRFARNINLLAAARQRVP